MEIESKKKQTINSNYNVLLRIKPIDGEIQNITQITQNSITIKDIP